jgi:Ala-tRNA(Pro) deacylase
MPTERTMPMLTKLRKALDESHVPYAVRSHAKAFTARGVAAAEHVPNREVAKVVILRSGDEFLMAVLPALYRVDVTRLRHALGKPDLHLATEAEFSKLFPECELGAMPPFGNLYGLPVWIDEPLTHEPEIVFNAGTHTETVHMAYADFARLVRPEVASFGEVDD